MSWRAWLFRLARLAVLVAVAVLLHLQHRYFEAQRGAPAIAMEDVRSLYPEAAGLGDADPATGRRSVKGADGAVVGAVALTSPEGDGITGYAGATRSLVAFAPGGEAIAFRIVHSDDTPEHVTKLLRDRAFMNTFESGVESVSGATLTAAATIGSIRAKLGASPTGSALFALPPTLADVQDLFPDAASLADGEVLGADGAVLGSIVRTSPAADAIIGYQGPTDALVGFGPDGRVIGFTVRESYDNPEYLGYFRYEPGYYRIFDGKTAPEVAAMDSEAIEGVSGATLSSTAIARGIIESMPTMAEEPAPEPRAPVPSAHEWGTVLMIILGCVLAFSGLRGNRKLRFVWQLALVGYLGLTVGNLLAQSLLVGWSRSGDVPWRLAPGLVLLAAAALAVPWGSGRNVYCHQLCPHGAAQELIGRASRWRIAVPQRVDRVLRWVPGVSLGGLVVIALAPVSANFAAFEPFNAYLFNVAGVATIALAIAGFAASLFLRMPYCRYGCPTGALLKFVRTGGSGDRWGGRDWSALILLCIAGFLYWQRGFLWSALA